MKVPSHSTGEARDCHHGLPGRRLFRSPWCWFLLFPALSAQAQESTTAGFEIMSMDDREVVILPAVATSMQMPSELGPIGGHSYETASRRIHVIAFDGEVFRASTPLEGAPSRIVFDTSQRKFVQLLPSIRVELEGHIELDSIAEKIGAKNVTSFETLGFAFIDLPDTIHPVDAIKQLDALPERPNGSIRVRRPNIEWR